jgi:hypothetical protein
MTADPTGKRSNTVCAGGKSIKPTVQGTAGTYSLGQVKDGKTTF